MPSYDGSGLLMGLAHWFFSGLAVLLTAYVVPGFKVKNFATALLAAVAIGLANIFIKPFLVFLTFPVTILTLGLFLIVVNAAVLRICAWVLRDFTISGWLPAIFGGLILSFVGTLLHAFFV